ncbi:ABC transporter substrate-binding protein [Petrotoga halophila]|uniref:Peptide ABC transporter substrate-binding protein n=1 Tax=Petrotoga halophila DSM 16923 TaxID=1122953 RepID=A0A2S5EA07_9BACT|nr:ABC transporter substrate-binding protein [Petrotoga halophila]POZ89983.1 peptide ABC transporter substrate-binding protein [Petrotoga halophila DSM 16923]
MNKKVVVVSLLMASLLVTSIFGWNAYSTPQEYYKETDKRITEFKESPILTEKVKQGELPPLEERLPKEPLVIVPEEEVGKFGGTWRRVWKGPSDQWGVYKINEPHLIYFSADGGEFLPGVAKSWEVLENGKVYIFHLREGMKWSDGHPYTADDIVFWANDIVGNDEYTSAKPAWYMAGGKRAKVEKIDDYTVKFEFAEPYSLFLLQVAYSQGFTGAPKHYLKQFHPDYTPMEEIEKIIEEEKEKMYSSWVDVFEDKYDPISNLELPSLWTWIPKTDPTSSFYILERNPYYFAVDIEGNQLPYIDTVRHEYVMDDEVVLLKAISGEIDMQWRHIGMMGAGAGNYTLLAMNKERGDYQIYNWIAANGSVSQLMLNTFDHSDPILQEIFSDVRFRQALSLGINREEINEILFSGLAEPRQASLVSGSAYYDPEWESAYAEYNPEKANELLDEMGLVWDSKHEYRLRPDGKSLQFTVQVVGQPHVDVWTMVREYWKNDLGIEIEVENLEQSLYYERLDAHDFDGQVWMMDRAAQPLADPFFVFPGAADISTTWYIGWTDWIKAYIEGNEPEPDDIVPPEPVIELVDLWLEIQKTTDEEKLKELMKEVTKTHRENIWMIGTVGEDIAPVIVKNNFKNVARELVTDDVLRSPLNTMPMQFYIVE